MGHGSGRRLPPKDCRQAFARAFGGVRRGVRGGPDVVREDLHRQAPGPVPLFLTQRPQRMSCRKGRKEEIFKLNVRHTAKSMADYRHPIAAFGTQIKSPLNVIILYGIRPYIYNHSNHYQYNYNIFHILIYYLFYLYYS